MGTITTKEQHNITIKEQTDPFNQSKAFIEHLLDAEQMHGSCGLYAKVTVEPGAEIAYHRHDKESETYYILSGEGIYSDNGKEMMVTPGYTTFTQDGESHGIQNRGTEDLVFMALIIKD